MYIMPVGPKLMILKTSLTIVTLMVLGNLEAAPEETMQLKGADQGQVKMLTKNSAS